MMIETSEIVRRRNNLGWTQAELARRTELTVQTISNVEVGRFPPRGATLAKIQQALEEGERARANRL